MTSKPNYRYILAGAGCAGLSLAYHLAKSPLAGEKILLIDREWRTENDRTWCFWTEEDHAFPSIVSRRWEKVAYRDPEVQLEQSIFPLQYQMIQSSDYYAYIQAELAQHPQIEFMQGDIEGFSRAGDHPYVQVGNRRLTAEYIFNSTFTPGLLSTLPRRKNAVWQHFKGWIIQTEEEVFDPTKAVLMDFRTDEPHLPSFFYCLPFSKQEALVEYTLFTEKLLTDQAYDQKLSAYIKRYVVSNTPYAIVHQERGKIPMTDGHFHKQIGHQIYQIGTIGGAVKPSTGYAFMAIQEESKRIVDRLLRGLDPGKPEKRSVRFRFYDRLFLEILQSNPIQAVPIFQALFRRLPFRDILRFMGEGTTVWQEMKIFANLPWAPFLAAIPRIYPIFDKYKMARNFWMSKRKKQKSHVVS